MSYWASKSVQPFGFCRYISSWKSRCLKLCLKKHGENLKIFFHFEVPQLRHPSTEWTQKVLGTTTFTSDHVCKISFRLLNIFEKLCHGERIALDREEEKTKKKKTKKEVRIIFWRAMFGVNYLKTGGEKNLKFFESGLEFLYFDIMKNEGRGSNRLGVKKSQKTQIVRSSKQTQYAEQRSCSA